jgi:tetratricopeptide (TPR) repeat protein
MKLIFILFAFTAAFHTQTYAQSKKKILEEANSKVKRNERILDSLEELVSKYKNENYLLKNNNDVTIQSIDSLKKSKIHLAVKITDESQKEKSLNADFNNEIKRIESNPRYLDEVISILRFIYSSKSCEEKNSTNSQDFIKSIKYFEDQAELLFNKAKEEDSLIARELMHAYFSHSENSDYIIKALNYAAPGKQEASDLAYLFDILKDQSKITECIKYFNLLEKKYPNDNSFLDAFRLSKIIDVYEETIEYEKALYYSNLLINSFPTKKRRNYDYSQRSRIYAKLNKFDLALKDIDKSISLYKKENSDLSNLYSKELQKCSILLALDRYAEANALSDKLISDFSVTEASRKFMSPKKGWILCKKAICLYELGKTSQADDIFDFITLYFKCSELYFSCGEWEWDICTYHETHY